MTIIENDWNWKNRLSYRMSTEYIALHHAASKSCTASQVDEWHKANGWSGIGYHFFVSKLGYIYRGRPIDRMGAHVSGMNNKSIGICAEGNYDVETNMPTAQKNAIKKLLRYLKEKYPTAKIVGHREIGSSDCPGKYYPLDELKNNYMDDEEEIDMEELNKLKLELTAYKTKTDDTINRMSKEIASLKPDIYDYIDKNMPDWARPTVQKLVGRGALKGDSDGRLGLTYDLMRLLVILDRVGVLG